MIINSPDTVKKNDIRAPRMVENDPQKLPVATKKVATIGQKNGKSRGGDESRGYAPAPTRLGFLLA